MFNQTKPRAPIIAWCIFGIILSLLALYFLDGLSEFAVDLFGSEIGKAKLAQLRNERSQEQLHNTLSEVRNQLSGDLALYLPKQVNDFDRFGHFIDPMRETTKYLVRRRHSIKGVFDRRIRCLNALPGTLNRAATTYRQYADAEDEKFLRDAYLAQARACEQSAERVEPQIARYEKLRDSALTEIGFLDRSDALLCHTHDFLELSPDKVGDTSAADFLIQLNTFLDRYGRIIEFFKQLPHQSSVADSHV